MKKLVKILPVLLLIVLVSSFIPVFAADAGLIDPSTFTGTQTSSFNNIGNRIIGMVQAIGSIVSVLVLVVLGVKYMMGSAEEKAEYKKTFMPYIIGAILVFAASNLASMIFSFASTISK